MHTDIAIIGMAGRFPDASSIEALHVNLREGRDSVRGVSEARIYNTSLSSQANYQPCALLEDIDKFDYGYFNISPGEAIYIDPHQKLLLEVVHEVIENAGYNIDFFNGTKAAVFIGDIAQQYTHLARAFDPMLITGTLNAGAAGRVARFFNLTGSAMMIDTACSSSLVALHMACMEILAGEAPYAFACGAKITLFPRTKTDIDDKAGGIVSPTGKANAFSANADGTACGEAVVGVLLKPLKQALKDRDVIHAVIRGSAINQDAGRSSNLTAPSSIAQAEVIRQAWHKARVDPATIGYIEAHGTGTKIGDPIEVDGINMAFGGFTNKKQFCALSSIKTNLGHTDSAAGLTGLAKAVLSLKHKEFFPSLHFSEPNPFINLIDSAVYVNTTLTPWEVAENQKRRAGVSSFGLSGTNCHVVLEEAPPVAHAKGGVPGPRLVTLSGKTTESLDNNKEALLQFLDTHPGTDLNDVSYTLTVGRKHHPCRYAAVVSSVTELRKRLLETPPALVPGASPAGPAEVWFLFSESVSVTEAALEKLGRTYPEYGQLYRACLETQVGRATDDRQRGFIFQYCLFGFLQQLGIKTKKVVGAGYGKILIEVLKGALSLEEGLLRAAPLPAVPEGNVEARIDRFVSTLAANGPALVVHLGSSPEVRNALARAHGATHAFALVDLPGDDSPAVVPQLVKELYGYGLALDFEPLFAGNQKAYRRISLPGYQFLRKRSWLENEENNPANWLYTLNWRETAHDQPPADPAGGAIVVFMGNPALGEALLQILEKNNRCIKVYPGSEFARITGEAYRIAWDREEDFARLYEHLAGESVDISGMIHLFGAAGGEATDEVLAQNLYPLLYTAKAFDAALSKPGFYAVVVTANARLVTHAETAHSAELSTTHGFVSALIQEYAQLKAKCIDVDAAAAEFSAPAAAERIAKEIGAGFDNLVVAHRGGKRYLQIIEKISVPAGAAPASMPIRPGGVYVITGGARGIGLEIAKYLGSLERVRIVVIGLRRFPPKSGWRQPSGEYGRDVRSTLEVFNHLEDQGNEVAYYQADVGDERAIDTVFSQVYGAYGRVDGIIHSAGVGGKLRVRRHTLESFKEALVPKIHGTVNLFKRVEGKPLDFFLLFSSLNAIKGTDRGSNYSAANMYLDNFVHRLRRDGINAKAIRWAFWRETGMGKRYHQYDDVKISDAFSLSNQEGVQAFEKIAGSACADVIVSKFDPNAAGENVYFKASGHPKESPGPAPRRADAVTALPAFPSNPDWTPFENSVAAVWKEVLKVPTLALEDNFFQIGGHSLLGVRIRNLIEKGFGIGLEYSDLVRFPTIRMLALYVQQLVESGNEEAYEHIPVCGPSEFYEISHAQKGVWLQCQVGQSQEAYTITSACSISNGLDAQAFGRAIELVTRRHESLRTTFVSVAGEPRQKVNAFQPAVHRMQYVDVSGEPNPQEAFQASFRWHCAQPFDLEKGPLFRVVLFRTDAEKHVLLMTLHHIVADGWSLRIIQNEVLNYYHKNSRLAHVDQAPLRVQYKDYVAWHQKQLYGGATNAHQQFWASQLQNLPAPLDFNLRKDRPRTRTYNGAVFTHAIESPFLEALEQLSRQAHTTLFNALLSVLNVLFYRYTGATDIVLGTPTSGRVHADLEDQVGLFLNTLVLRTRFSAEDSFLDLLDKVNLVTSHAYQHQAYPFDKLVEDLRLAHDRSRHPVFDVMVDMIDFDFVAQPGEEGSLQVNGFPTSHAQSKFDLTVYFTRQPSRVMTSFEYNTDLFTDDEVRRMANRFATLLKSITADPRLSISDLRVDALPVMKHIAPIAR